MLDILLALIELDLAHPDPDVRCRAVEQARTAPERPWPRLLPLLGDPHPRVRRRAILLFRDFKPELLRSALKHPQAAVREGACRAIPAKDLLLDRLGDPHPDVRAAAVEALGGLRDHSVAERLIELLKKETSWAPRAFALEALHRSDAERSLPILEAAPREPQPEVRIVAAELRPSAELLADRDWRVRAAAVEACRRLRSREAIGWLIGQLPREKGRLRWDLVQALADLTGRDLGLAADSWAAWWNANRDTFVPPAKGVAASSGTQASFFSVPILSTRLVFLLDLSGSMREPGPSGASKLDEARRGMLDTLRALAPDVRFGLCGLGCDADGAFSKKEEKTWGRRLRLFPAVPAAKADAERFLSGLEARGWTNLYDGLLHATSDPEVDSVFLYSDGGASKGLFVAAGEILEEFGRVNRFRRVVVHCIEVPGERNPADNKRLLAELAGRSGGSSKLHEMK